MNKITFRDNIGKAIVTFQNFQLIEESVMFFCKMELKIEYEGFYYYGITQVEKSDLAKLEQDFLSLRDGKFTEFWFLPIENDLIMNFKINIQGQITNTCMMRSGDSEANMEVSFYNNQSFINDLVREIREVYKEL